MSLKAVIFDFNGIIINDESIHRQLTEEMLLGENLNMQAGEFEKVCLGRSDRSCFRDLLANSGRIVDEQYLEKLLQNKTKAYAKKLEEVEQLPIYPGVEDIIYKARSRELKIGLVSGALGSDIELVINRANLAQYFEVVVSTDDVTTSKPEPEGYLLSVELLNKKHPDLNLQPQECLAIEDTPAGIQAAKNAGMQVVAVANTYPFHMLQRQANWTVDYLTDLELERIQETFLQQGLQATTGES
ncbi:MAG: HAD family phosphatase [Cyanobacteria bacterium P01_A01_bin.84]